MPTAGYSGTPLAKKLGIQSGYRVKLINPPVNYEQWLGPLDDVMFSTRIRQDIDLIHMFVDRRNELKKRLESAIPQMRRAGMIWVSWPKKSSGVFSEVTEDTVRELALPLGLVDVKVCAVDETWSGLKLVIRKELR